MYPLRCVWVAPGLAGATLKKKLTVTQHFCDSDYTRVDSASHLEICIRQIHFSDSLPDGPQGKPAVGFTPSSSDANLTPGNSLRGLLASRPCHRIMHRAGKPAAGIVLSKRSSAAAGRMAFSSEVL